MCTDAVLSPEGSSSQSTSSPNQNQMLLYFGHQIPKLVSLPNTQSKEVDLILDLISDLLKPSDEIDVHKRNTLLKTMMSSITSSLHNALKTSNFDLD